MLKFLIAALLMAASPLATSAPAGNIWPPRNYDPGVFVEWNELLVDSVPSTVGGMLPRYYALMHIAMYDAMNSIEGDHSPMHVRVRAARHASTDAAAAQAAHDVLVALLPDKKAAFAEARNVSPRSTRLAPSLACKWAAKSLARCWRGDRCQLRRDAHRHPRRQ